MDDTWSSSSRTCVALRCVIYQQSNHSHWSKPNHYRTSSEGKIPEGQVLIALLDISRIDADPLTARYRTLPNELRLIVFKAYIWNFLEPPVLARITDDTYDLCCDPYRERNDAIRRNGYEWMLRLKVISDMETTHALFFEAVHALFRAAREMTKTDETAVKQMLDKRCKLGRADELDTPEYADIEAKLDLCFLRLEHLQEASYRLKELCRERQRKIQEETEQALRQSQSVVARLRILVEESTYAKAALRQENLRLSA